MFCDDGKPLTTYEVQSTTQYFFYLNSQKALLVTQLDVVAA